MAESGRLWVAEADGEPAGALVLGEPPEWIPPVDEPETYVRFLITSRRFAVGDWQGQVLEQRLD